MSTSARRLLTACVLGSGMLIGDLAAVPASAQSCDASCPDFCIAPVYEVGDLDCAQVAGGNFTVYQPDPHYFDGDYDGIGCEWN